MVEVLTPGSPAQLTATDKQVKVLAVLLRGRNIQYECAWWDGEIRHTAWLELCEVEETEQSYIKTKIGFHTDDA